MERVMVTTKKFSQGQCADMGIPMSAKLGSQCAAHQPKRKPLYWPEVKNLWEVLPSVNIPEINSIFSFI